MAPLWLWNATLMGAVCMVHVRVTGALADDEAHTIYVWLDALTNYLTVTGFGAQADGSVVAGAAWPPDVQVMTTACAGVVTHTA